MLTYLRKVLRLILPYASGEIAGRLFSVAALMLLGHAYGVQTMGVYSLAVAISWYTVPFVDFGLRHIGARLIARHPGHVSFIVSCVQRRRGLMAAAAVPLLMIYAILARVPASLKWFLFFFPATSLLYGLSLDWVAWGKERFQLQTLLRALVPFSILFSLLIGYVAHSQVLWYAVIGNILGYTLQIVALRRWWDNSHDHHDKARPEDATADVLQSLSFRRTGITGMTWFAQMAFNSIDQLMLGVMSTTEQVGLYSSAYRILTQVLVAYYWIILPLFPMLARQSEQRRKELLQPRILLILAGAGIALGAPVLMCRRILLEAVFGRQFVVAAPLVAVLLWAIPLDFVTSYLNNAYLAWDMEKRLLPAVAFASGINIICNLVFIPRYGAMAAALSTIIAYFVYLGGLLVIGAKLRHSEHLGSR